MLIRCRCGIYTNYGMVCTSCRDDIQTHRVSVAKKDKEEEEEEIVEVPLDDFLLSEDGYEED